MEEAVITVVEIVEFKFAEGKKTGYKLQTREGDDYACFSSTEIAKINPDVPVRVRYKVVNRNGFDNRNIIQIANEKNEFEDRPPTQTGGRPGKADPDKLRQDRELEIARNKSIQRQVAAKEASQIVIASGVSPSDDPTTFYKVWDVAYDHVLTKLLEVK